MNKKILIAIIVIIALVIVVSFLLYKGKLCVSDFTCKNYCYEKGNYGVISYSSACKSFTCECTCQSGMCD